MRFICNSCVGKLNKYILIKQYKSQTEAETFCEQNLGTSLASIHSQYDNGILCLKKSFVYQSIYLFVTR